MGNYNRGGGGNRGRNDKRNDSRGDSRHDSRGDREMFSAVCAECGDKCEVPFKPTGNKPVLCRNCFSRDNGRDNGRDTSRDNGRDSGRSRKTMGEGRSEHYDLEFQKLNDKLDKILQRLTPVHTRDGIKDPESENEDEDTDLDL